MPGHISEYDHYGAGIEFIELAIPEGTDVSSYTVVIYGSDGYVDHTINLSDLSVQNTIGGHDVYLIEAGTPGFSGIEFGDSTAFVDDTGTVLQFVTHTSAVEAQDGPAAGETSTYIGTANGDGKSLQSNDGGSRYFVQETPNSGTIPCYAPDTMIDTPDGPRAVETLKPGDLVLTRDHGAQPIRWIRSGEHPLERAERDAKPVLIKAEALGRNLPGRDLIVSPQHRIFVGGGGQLEAVFGFEAFAPAKALTGLPGIRHMMGKARITWIHFACARHEVVCANGCWSESLLLGPMVMQGLPKAQRDALYELFRSEASNSALNGPPARPCLKVDEARRMTACHSTSARIAA